MQANIKVAKFLEFYEQATSNNTIKITYMTTGKSYFSYELLQSETFVFQKMAFQVKSK